MVKIVNDYKAMSKYESRNLMAIFTGENAKQGF